MFTSNALQWATSIRAEGVVRSVTGDGRGSGDEGPLGIATEEAEDSTRMARQDNLFGSPLPTVHDLTGLAPRTFRDWAIDNLAAFR